jgi:pimeloyl-ACP methyl ester carboxylesterase
VTSSECRITKEEVALSISGAALRVSALHRPGSRAPVVFLHGFGSTKEDYADIAFRPEFSGRGVLAYDAPGCGETEIDDLSPVSVPFLVRTAIAMLDRYDIDRFHLVGHSMGGLTSLLLADQIPDRVLSFTDIEGNLAPEDCFLSRQIISHHVVDDDRFFEEFVDRTWHSRFFASPLFAASLRHKVRPGAVRGIFESMVGLSDNGDLMTRFLRLPFPRMFMFGDQNASLSYLADLKDHGVELAEIPQCGHFPMYSNPPVMWASISQFIERAED